MTDTSKLQKVFKAYTPQRIAIKSIDLLPQTNLYFYGEIHGAKENADIIFTLCQHLSIEQLAIEYSHSIDKFIQNSARGAVDFSLLDTKMFDTSILSIEMLKTIVELLRLGIVRQIIYIDETFDYTEEQWRKITDPDWREIVMAREIGKTDASRRTLCMTGSWHAQTRRTAEHISALCRVRESNLGAVLIQNVYRGGEIRNSGRLIKLPSRNDLPNNYEIVRNTKRNFALVVPEARAIESAATRHLPPTG